MGATYVVNFGQSACYPHSTLAAPELLVPPETAYGIKRCVKTLRHAANQEVQTYVNVITGEEASNTDPQPTVHHLNPLNKHLYRR